MDNRIVIQRGRTKVVGVGLGEDVDVSGDTFTSQIREQTNADSDLIAEWTVTFLTDGTDGELVLTLLDIDTATIEHTNGFMDIKKVVGGRAYPVFNEPIPVVFKGVVTE